MAIKTITSTINPQGGHDITIGVIENPLRIKDMRTKLVPAINASKAVDAATAALKFLDSDVATIDGTVVLARLDGFVFLSVDQKTGLKSILTALALGILEAP